MLSKLRESYLLRSLFYYMLKNLNTSRKMIGTDKRLYFNAGTNLNLFFSRIASIEPVITNNIKGFLRKNFTIYDIGANIGYYTLFFSQLVSEGRVIAFEPDPVNFRYLLKNKELNKLTNVTLINKGVSSKTGMSEFYQDVSTGRTSSLENDAWHPNATKLNRLVVENTTLNESSKVYGQPDIIKCDVEGHELEVLLGADQVLINNPMLILEVKETNREKVAKILRKNHYKFFNAELPLNPIDKPAACIKFSNVLCLKNTFE